VKRRLGEKSHALDYVFKLENVRPHQVKFERKSQYRRTSCGKKVHKCKAIVVSVIITKCETDWQHGAPAGYKAAIKRADTLFWISVVSVAVNELCIFVQLKFRYVLGTFKIRSKEAENSFLSIFLFLLFQNIEIKLRSRLFKDIV
jgi:hypothetical protein